MVSYHPHNHVEIYWSTAEVIRIYQTSQLRECYNMTSVMIYRDRLARSFENQVMATYVTPSWFRKYLTWNDYRPNFEEDIPLVVIFHDPWAYPFRLGQPNWLTYFRPEIMGTPNPVSRQLELHNTWLVRDQSISRTIFADLRKGWWLKALHWLGY